MLEKAILPTCGLLFFPHHNQQGFVTLLFFGRDHSLNRQQDDARPEDRTEHITTYAGMLAVSTDSGAQIHPACSPVDERSLLAEKTVTRRSFSKKV